MDSNSRVSRNNEISDEDVTRVAKNQELYEEVSLNSNLKDIVSLDKVLELDSSIKINTRGDYQRFREYKDILNKSGEKESPIIDSLQVDKVYDINQVIMDAKKNKEDDDLIRSLSNTEYSLENLQLNIKKQDEDNNSDLLSDLMPKDENTLVIAKNDDDDDNDSREELKNIDNSFYSKSMDLKEIDFLSETEIKRSKIFIFVLVFFIVIVMLALAYVLFSYFKL